VVANMSFTIVSIWNFKTDRFTALTAKVHKTSLK
ncbi:MAG: hypothetical protein ACI89Z_001235, partial [Porticoccus sp.]